MLERGSPLTGGFTRVLTGVAYLALLLGLPEARDPTLVVILGAVYSAVAVVGFTWVQRRTGRRRTPLGAAYVVVELLLGYAVFVLSGSTVGALLLLLVLVSQSVLLLPLPGAVVVAALLPLMHIGMEWGEGLREGIGTLAAAAFTAVVTELLKREQRARAELAAANAQLRDYAAQAEKLATTEERNRLARDIHDGLGHHLTVVQMQVQAARAVLAADPARADAVLAKAQQQSSEALAEIRRSVSSLREPRSSPPLPEALAGLAAETSAAGVPTELEVTGSPRTLLPDAEDSLFRAAQEGLTNVRKHAQAGRARLALDYERADTVRLEVRDDGTGVVTPVAETDGFGLLGLRERAARLGGTVAVDSTPGRGLTLRVEVPG